MIRWLLLAALVTAIPFLTDKLVDWQFRKVQHQETGYTRADLDGMARLVEQSLAKPKHQVSREDINALFGRENTP